MGTRTTVYFFFLCQNSNGLQLTILNFGAPFLLTVVFIMLAGQRLIFKRDIIERLWMPKAAKLLIVALILLIVGWQVWYLITLYQIKQRIGLVEFGPIFFGVICSLFLAA